MLQLWLVLSSCLVATEMASGHGTGEVTVSKTIGSDEQGTTFRNPVMLKRKIWGSYKGRIDLDLNEGPVYKVEVLRYTKYKEGRKVDITVEGNGVKDTITIPCPNCGETVIYNDKKKVVVSDTNDVYGILGKTKTRGALVVVRNGGCVERKYVLKMPVERKLKQYRCDSAIREIRNPEGKYFVRLLVQLYLSLLGQISRLFQRIFT